MYFVTGCLCCTLGRHLKTVGGFLKGENLMKVISSRSCPVLKTKKLQSRSEQLLFPLCHCGFSVNLVKKCNTIQKSYKHIFVNRKKYNIMPKMSFSRENYRKGLAAVEARKNYRKSFMISNARKNLEEHKKLL